MTGLLRREQSGAVLRLILSDEATRNSLSETMLAELRDALVVDASVHVIIIAATGSAFSSGHNLKELTAHRTDTDKGAAYFERIFSTCSALMISISHHRCAVIAEVDGLASAAGCQLVASCDLAYASPRARFCTPGVNIGLFCSTPMVPLSRTIHAKQAMEMLLLGDAQDADFALSAGLINGIVSQNELSSHVNGLAHKIAAKSQAAISYGKRLFHDQHPLPLADAYALTSRIMVANMLDGAACEGLSAFIKKRQAQWPKLS